MQNYPVLVAPYCGQNQQQRIMVSDSVALREGGPEKGCWAMIPYAVRFPQRQLDYLPPPLSKTDLWSAQQTWPL
jgi:hypothetical protein